MASLYSGGKDSSFSLYVAEQMGHEIPYLVNVVPEDRASWIFHTPNLNVVPAIAEAMGKDKKAEGGLVHFVLAERPGSAVIRDLSVAAALNALKQI